MADSNVPKYTLIRRTGKTVASAIEKALESAKKSDTATTVITSLNGTAFAASVEGDVLSLTAITPTTTTITIIAQKFNGSLMVTLKLSHTPPEVPTTFT